MEDLVYKLLYIEDDKVDQMAFKRFVKQEGRMLNYRLAASIKESKEILKTDRFDIVLVDYMLGDGTAFEIFDYLKNNPFIILTGIGDEKIAVKAMKAGAYDYLIKDTGCNYLKLLPSIIENAIRLKRTQDELNKYHSQLEALVDERTKELRKEIEERKKEEEKRKASETQYHELKEKVLREKNDILVKANMDTIIVLSQTIEAKDPYTRGHCLRVRDYSKALGMFFGFSKEKLLLLEFGALLHDIGKIGIPGVILNKNGSLTDEEYTEIKKHPDIGAGIIEQVDFFKPIVPMVKYHHERYDGNGYPDGLSTHRIPREARILTVGDTFDAMTSDRPYRKAIPIPKALAIIKEAAGTQLDPEIVDIFISKEIYAIKHAEKLHFDF